jgi:hypothetical protein
MLHACPMSSSSIWLHYNIWRGVPITKLVVMKFPPSVVTSFVLGTNVFLSTMFSNSLAPCTSLHMRDQLQIPYKTSGKMIVVCIQYLSFQMPNKNKKGFCTEWYQAVPELICSPYIRAWGFDLLLSFTNFRKSPHIQALYLVCLLRFCSAVSLFNCSVSHSFKFHVETDHSPHFCRPASPHARLSG